MFFEHAMLSFQSPSAQLHKAFWHKFHNYDSEHGPFETLGGHSARIYEDLRDLVSLHRQPEEDRLTAFLREYFSVLFIVSRSLPKIAEGVGNRRLLTVGRNLRASRQTPRWRTPRSAACN